MSEIQQIYRQIKQLEAEQIRLTILEPKWGLAATSLLFAFSVAEKATVLSTLSLGLAGCILARMSVSNSIEKEKEENLKRYYEKSCQFHSYVQMGVRMAFDELRNETSPKARREIINTIRWMKQADIIRKADRKALAGLTGKKRKGLASGLKALRKNIGKMSREEYIVARENILSYY